MSSAGEDGRDGRPIAKARASRSEEGAGFRDPGAFGLGPRAAAAATLAALAFWVLVDWNLLAAEMVLGLSAALAAAGALYLVARTDDEASAIPWRPGLRLVLAALAPVPRDLARVLAATVLQLLRPRRRETAGSFEQRPFHPAANGPAEADGWWALAVFGICLAPNSYVVMDDPSAGALLVHHLVPEPERPRNPRWPL